MSDDIARLFHEIAEAARWIDACDPGGYSAAEERKLAEERARRWTTPTPTAEDVLRDVLSTAGVRP